jgi:cytidylate kinase
MKLLGIAGTDGSGKDSLGLFLQAKYGWLFVSVTDLLRDEARKRDMPLLRSTLRIISAEWRSESGLGILIDKAVAEFNNRQEKFNGLVLASLRNPGEVDRVHKLGGKVIWLDAPIELRYKRAKKRNKGTEDQITFEEFKAEENAQMTHQGDETTLNLSGVKAKADIFINNDTDNIEDFKRSIAKALKGLL